MPTKEDYGQGKVAEMATFRTYDSLQDNLKGYTNFLMTGKNDDGSPRYQKALESEDPMTYLIELKNAGYATDQDYIDLVGGVYKRAKDKGIFK